MKVVVTSPSFSKSIHLRALLKKSFNEVVFNDDGYRYSGKELVDYIANADAAIVGLELIDESLLNASPKLKYISKYGVGLDNIDLEICAKRNVKIGWKPGVNKTSVAEHALGLILNLCHNINYTSNQLRNQLWNKSGGRQLHERTIGIIGVGNIGKELIRLLQPFNCKILVNDIINQDDYYSEQKLKEVSKRELLEQSDIISIHTPLNEEMNHFMNRQNFQMMKSDAILINTARGGIVNTSDLIQAIKNGDISGAALDVHENEPKVSDALVALENIICTPHIAGNAHEAVVAMGESAIEQLIKITN